MELGRGAVAAAAAQRGGGRRALRTRPRPQTRGCCRIEASARMSPASLNKSPDLKSGFLKLFLELNSEVKSSSVISFSSKYPWVAICKIEGLLKDFSKL